MLSVQNNINSQIKLGILNLNQSPADTLTDFNEPQALPTLLVLPQSEMPEL